MENKLKSVSKYLSFVLRHKPEAIGLELDSNGWASIQDLIAKTTSYTLTEELIHIVVETNDKQRFAIDSTKQVIRANQGHSVEVDLNLQPVEPPDFLLHGTAERFEELILKNGLNKQKRHHVHLSETETVAKAVGSRHGKPVIFKINAKEMRKAGYQFYKTANNVWLVNEVPSRFMVKL